MRKKNTFSHIKLEDWKTTEEEEYDGEVFSTELIQELIDNLPTGYKMVFNLYVIEGFKHQEIAKMLQIAEGTSKSQLAHARKMLQEGLKIIKTYKMALHKFEKQFKMQFKTEALRRLNHHGID